MYLIRHVAILVQLTLVMLSPYISVILASQIDDITQHVTKVSAMIESLIDLHVTYSDEFNVSRYHCIQIKKASNLRILVCLMSGDASICSIKHLVVLTGILGILSDRSLQIQRTVTRLF